MTLLLQNATYTRMFYLGQTSLTPVLQISKAGGAFTDPHAGVSIATEVGQGWYKFALAVEDTDTLGELAYAFGSGSQNAEFHDQVLAALPGGNVTLAASQPLYAPAIAGDAMAITGPAQTGIADAILGRADGIETGFTLRQALRIILSALGGKLAISGPSVTIRDVNDTKNRITATTDADGQRTAVTLNVS